jgi:pyrimidine-specific ribonucleoside hydrolase
MRHFPQWQGPGSAPGASLTAVVVDCDPGVDDAAALALAARSPELDLRAVTTVTGNVPVELSTTNALAVLGVLGRGDVPVAAGADRGLVRTKPDHASVHGPNGLGGVELPAPAVAAAQGHAVDVLGSLLELVPLTIVAIGPLTNIAMLLALRPELAGRIARIVIMGGSVGPGNVTPAAEYNVWADPESAARVLGSGVEICVAQLGVTALATLDDDDRRRLAAGSTVGAHLKAMLDGYVEGRDIESALHDVVAVAATIDADVLATRPATVDVVTDLGPARGETRFCFDGPAAESSHIHVAVELDAERLRRLLLERISGAVDGGGHGHPGSPGLPGSPGSSGYPGSSGSSGPG